MEEQINQFVMEQRDMAGEESRSRERRRDRDRDRRRDRRRRSDRDRGDRGWDRDRSRDDRDADRDCDGRYDNDRYGYCDRDEDYKDNWDKGHDGGGYHNGEDNSYRRDYGGHRGGEKWMTATPTDTILLKGLPLHIYAKDIRTELMQVGAPIKEIRLMKKHDTGVSRGFAFVEFQSVIAAQRWMEQKQGCLLLRNQYPVNMYYSRQRSAADMSEYMWTRSDWVCSKCRVHNFKRRDHCFRCSLSREESDKCKDTDGSDQVGTNPCNTLILQGLDALTVEENIIAVLSKVTALGIKNMKVMRDPTTGTSLSYAFVEMNSVQDSINLLATIKRLAAFEVDGKAVIVSFAKNTFSTVIATMHLWSQQRQWEYSNQYATDQAAYYDSAAHNPDAYGHANSTNAAAAVAQQAIEQAQAAKNYERSQQDMQKKMLSDMQQQHRMSEMTAEERLRTPDGTDVTKHSVPDVSTYQYDETSGYYYDPQTRLYYDANSQYYYNAETGKFLYWDGEKQAYLPAPESQDTQALQLAGDASTAATAATVTTAAADSTERKGDDVELKDKKDKEKKEKVKVAKKIAKDMEKWAKSMNAQKDALKDNFKKPAPPTATGVVTPSGDVDSATADLGYAILEMKSPNARNVTEFIANRDNKQMPPPPSHSETEVRDESGLVASYGGDSGDESDLADDAASEEEKFTDLSKMACLLCKRQFSSKEAIERHQQLSDLHKKNLEEWRRANPSKTSSLEDALAYRDRAKERRLKYGTTAPPPASKKRRSKPDNEEPVPYEQPTKHGIDETNIGNQLMQKMGWSKGQGLGKSGQGIVDPVKATHRQAQAGLGARGSAYNVEPGVTYKDCVKKTMFARYHYME